MNITATAQKLKANNTITEYDMANEYGVDLFNTAVYTEQKPQNPTEDELIDWWMEQFGPEEPKEGLDGALQFHWDMALMHETFMREQARRVEREIHALIAAEREANKCRRCNGHGYLAQYAHVYGGECFKCNGTGQNIGAGAKDAAVYEM